MTSGFTDISALGKLRLSGSSAYEFISTMTSADMLLLGVVGGACPALVLTGDGELIDVVMVIRTGQQEYMITTSAGLDTEVFEWLEAHAALKDDEGKPVFASIKLSNESEQVAQIALFGSDIEFVFAELGATAHEAQPKHVHLRIAKLANLDVLVFSYPLLNAQPYVELLFASAYRENMINLLLSFVELDQLNFTDFVEMRLERKTWFKQSDDAQYTTPKAAGFERLARSQGQFVGSQALN